MQFTALLAAAALALGASAQQVFINSPATGADVTAGQPFTIQVAKPNYIQNAPDVSIALGVTTCEGTRNGVCPGKSYAIYTVLYNGTYAPNDGVVRGRKYQNVTVTIPSDFTKGKAQLNGAHFYLVGAEFTAALETFNSTINVV